MPLSIVYFTLDDLIAMLKTRAIEAVHIQQLQEQEARGQLPISTLKSLIYITAHDPERDQIHAARFFLESITIMPGQPDIAAAMYDRAHDIRAWLTTHITNHTGADVYPGMIVAPGLRSEIAELRTDGSRYWQIKQPERSEESRRLIFAQPVTNEE